MEAARVAKPGAKHDGGDKESNAVLCLLTIGEVNRPHLEQAK